MTKMTAKDWEILAEFGVTPDNLVVHRDLDLRCSKIKALPEGLVVHGHLDLINTEIEEIPKSITVGKKLFLHRTKIPAIHTDERDYKLYRIETNSCTFYVAGCRIFRSASEAIEHWSSDDYPNSVRGQGFVDAILKAENGA